MSTLVKLLGFPHRTLELVKCVLFGWGKTLMTEDDHKWEC